MPFVIFAIPYTTMGNVNIPDAYCLPHLMMEISYINNFSQDVPVSGSPEKYNDYDFATQLRLGLFDRVDLGFVYASTAGYLSNLKIKIMDETERLPAFSCGLLNLFSEVADTEDKSSPALYDYPDYIDYIKYSPFGVISKSVVMVTGVSSFEYIEATFHLGMGARRFRGRGESSRYASGIFVGAELKPARFLKLYGEIDGQNANLGMDIILGNLTIGGAIYRLEELVKTQDAQRYAINISYTLDSFSEIKASEKRRKISYGNYLNSRPYNEGESLEDELERIRQRRLQAEKELEEIRKLLQNQE